MWFLMAIMTLLHNGGEERDVFIWHTPTFDSVVECREFVTNNQEAIFMQLAKEFPRDTMDRLICIDEKYLEKFMNEAVVEPGVKA